MNIEYDSHSLFFKEPFGAVECKKRVCIRILIEKAFWPDEVLLRCKVGEDEYNISMHYFSTMADMNVFEAFVDMPKKPCVWFYCFEIRLDKKIIFYGNNDEKLGGVGRCYEDNPKEYQITVFDSKYETPKWLREGIMYQIFPDRFYRSESFCGLDGSDEIIAREWGEVPFYSAEQFGGKYLANDCFGGSLRGIFEKLEYLKELGIDIIYLNPIFEAKSNHKYNTANYEKIDPLFGDEKDFERLCKKAESMGIKIILDGVFSHTGSESIYFNKSGKYDSLGACQGEKSEFYGWYNFYEFPEKYDCWWGFETLPNVNEMEESFLKYILTDENSIIKKWVRLGASGWRLDVADELPDEFIKILRRELKSIKADAAVIGEVWEDASNKLAYGKLRGYLGGFELDSVMNYPLRDMIISFVKGEIDSRLFNLKVMSLKENYPEPAFFAGMNFLSSHDTERILTRISNLPEAKTLSREEMATKKLEGVEFEIACQRLSLALILQFTIPGVPCIFYGDEAGVYGYNDPFCRQCFPWGNENKEIFEAYKKAIEIRKMSPAFYRGDICFVYGEEQTSGFIRSFEDEVYIIVVNFSAEYDRYVSLELGRFMICEIENVFEDERHFCDYGRFNIHIDKMSWKIYRGVVKND